MSGSLTGAEAVTFIHISDEALLIGDGNSEYRLNFGEATVHRSRCNSSVTGAVRTQKRKKKTRTSYTGVRVLTFIESYLSGLGFQSVRLFIALKVFLLECFSFDRVEEDNQQIEDNQDSQQDEKIRGDAAADAE